MELNSLQAKLDEALVAIIKLEKEKENLQETCDNLKNDFARLNEVRMELQEKLDSLPEIDANEPSHIVELNLLQVKLDESLVAINKLEEDKANLKENYDGLNNELARLNEVRLELQEKLDSQPEIENCSLKRIIDLCQMCEIRATVKSKDLHASSISHLEQIMDFEKAMKKKETNIESLKKDYDALQKKCKDLQTSAKKQLQTEQQRYVSEIEDIKNQKTTAEKEIAELKSKLTELEHEKDKLAGDVKNYKILQVKLAKEDTVERNVSQEQNECNTIEEESIGVVKDENCKTEENKLRSKTNMKTKKTEKISPKKIQALKKETTNAIKRIEQTEEKENQVRRTRTMTVEKKETVEKEKHIRRNLRRPGLTEVKEKTENTKKSPKIAKVDKKQIENKRNITETVENKIQNKITSRNPSISEENKKLKENITQNNKENTNSETGLKESRGPRMRLRTVENVLVDTMVLKKNLDPKETKSSKRKGRDDSFEEKSMKSLKKIKLQNIDFDPKFTSKPQNLRIQVLTGKMALNASPKPSPRLTRGRKRLFNSELFQNKENVSTNKNQRAVRW